MRNRFDPEYEQRLVDQACRYPESFRELYRHYFPRIYGYISYRVDSVSEAEDLTSATFLKAIEGLGRFEYRGPGSFAAWLFRIARNQVSDYRRHHQRRGESLPLETLPELQDGTVPPEQAAIRQEQNIHLHQLVSRLSPRRQEVIILKFYAGLRNREIAEILELDERSVASHLCRGLRELHRYCLDGRVWMQDGKE
ncbi:RNA polymerase sigma factor [Nitrolancea hollandica]|uniref:DNA-directed RNA polymerase specialized sigma subunit, sigma24 homolog n=1 Tax=Nitrolancea hollandica Lb TaxID=1129897 RepID=I4EI54_9BACT|nr:sigma-70 family RNA polymerase sigma factor [Nitrolancea hollandica]CCF84366.1 DNA-directed RNA polymerase specialized sigma subunit, sigma24 homolog [Nitrolancea hollandica Lb]